MKTASSLLIAALFVCKVFTAQNFSQNYIVNKNYKAPEADIKAICKQFDDFPKSLDLNMKIRKGVNESFHVLRDYVYSSDTADVLMFTDPVSVYVQSIVNHVQLKNPELAPFKYKVFVYRTGEPNAASLGQDVLFVNLGLISKMESEGQLAFILCHEMAHNTKKHVVDGIIKRQELLKDRDFRRKVRRASRQEYNRYRRLVDLYESYVADYTFNSRKNELTADSLGLEYFVKAGYDPYVGIKSIMKLDSIDGPLFKDSVDIKKLFAFKHVPFNPEWLQTEESVDLGNNLKDEKLADSLKTHPDCPERAAKLKDLIKRQNLDAAKKSFLSTDYNLIKKQAVFELIELYMDADNFGYAMYYAANYQKEYPNNEYLKYVISRCLSEIYFAQKQHNFSHVVDLPDPEFENSYNHFLKILHHLSGSDLNTISNYYYEDNLKVLSGTNSQFVGTFLACAKSKSLESESYIREFEKTNKDPYLAAVLKKRFIKQKK
ncbi:MAG: family metalloprotease [Bacteroidetes bacterium]|jgi:Zn-dependent protease with chaperone function|nr:family metalloprotease [Bacteroidota bacterium]